MTEQDEEISEILGIKTNEVELMKASIITAVKLDDDPRHLKEHMMFTFALDRESAEVTQMHYMQQDIDKIKKDLEWYKRAIIVLGGSIVAVAPVTIQEIIRFFVGAGL